MEYDKLNRFYIEANYCKHTKLISILEPMINKLRNINKNVIAKVTSSIDDICYHFDNLIKFEDESILKMVDDLLNKIGFIQSYSISCREKSSSIYIGTIQR